MKKTLVCVMVITAMMFAFCACGESEEVVEITSSAAEEANGDAQADSVYETIYNTYYQELEKNKNKFKKELEAEAGDLSKDDLYDLTKEKTDALNDIRDKGNSEMQDAVLASTSDDEDEYEKWYSKLTEATADFSRELTEIYTDSL